MTSERPDEIFARRLREVRTSRRVSQNELARQLAKRLGTKINGATITKIEKGDRGVRLEEAVYAAEILDVPLDSLVTGIHPIDARIAELQAQIEEQENRAKAAISEHGQATSAVVHLQDEIAQLEAKKQGRTGEG